MRPLVGLVAAVAVILSACGGAESVTPSASAPSLEPMERFQTPRTLDSYRYTLNISASGRLLDQSAAPPALGLEDAPLTIEIEGRWVSPDREHSSAAFAFGVLDAVQGSIRIGDRVWSSVEGGAWRERASLTRPEALVGQDLPLSPDAIFGDDEDEVLERLTADLVLRPHTVDTVDGREARHWRLDEEWFDTYGADFADVLAELTRGQGMLMDIDIWSDLETGVGTKLIVDARSPGEEDGLLLEMDLFDLNDPAIAVDEPIGAIGR